MGHATHLRCRACGAIYEAGPEYVCTECFGPLEVLYDYDWIAAQTTRQEIASGPGSIWRYRTLLPVEPQEADLQPGWTPLVRAHRLGRLLGLRNLYLKNDTTNPTWSFKDRVVAVAVSAARRFGFEVLACASTGNLANAVAAHAARAGMRAVVFVPVGLEPAKLIMSAVYGPTIVEVEGTYDDVNRLCTEIAGEYPWAFTNINVRPFYSEGCKTLAFETAEQLGWRFPDHVVIPVASGNLLVKTEKAFEELRRVGLVEGSLPRLHGAQPEGCSPIAAAFRQGLDQVRPVRPQTIAKSLAIGNPADGYYALQAVRRTGGVVEVATDEEIVEGIELLARTEGIFAETAGGTTVAVLRKLAEAGRLHPDATVVAFITGSGLKTTDALGNGGGRTLRIRPTLRDFEREVLAAV
ncbi:MAG: threonine synthase [Armatimonadota bacterium]|nr:threonine synthase [Armatimonadota bacterium]MDR7438799.1 threonine synthase [Armatimonadota bacterium]MDR7562105.1 threonine synthase [Armatimonadota bacterium]MDR7567854.1 threonine synthase [Armatimonadota bacterium]MDR7601951.1 threonine synthase [Armatimonadota bacterium]